MPTGKLIAGDAVIMRGEITQVHEDGRITVRLSGYGIPLTVERDHVERAEPRTGVAPPNRASGLTTP
jgi:hypothetical protein